MKNAAGHPVPPSAPTLTPLYTQTFRPYSPENCTHNKAIFAYKVGLGTINYLKTEHTSLYRLYVIIQKNSCINSQ